MDLKGSTSPYAFPGRGAAANVTNFFFNSGLKTAATPGNSPVNISPVNKENADPNLSFGSPNSRKKKGDSYDVHRAKRARRDNPDDDLGDESVTELLNKNVELEKQTQLLRKEKEALSTIEKNLRQQLVEQQQMKDHLLIELAEKAKKNAELEEEKNQKEQQLEEERQKLQKLEEQNKEQLKKLEYLDAALKENSVELHLKTQEYKELLKKFETLKEKEAKMSSDMEALAKDKQKLRSQLEDEGKTYQQSISNMEEQINNLKREFFFSTALAIKLNLASARPSWGFKKNNTPKNVDIQSLFEKAMTEGIPINNWPAWITKQF